MNSKIETFKCESAVFNGPLCRVQCESCKPESGRATTRCIGEVIERVTKPTGMLDPFRGGLLT